MLTSVRTKWFAGGGALLLVLAISGAALGADLAGDISPSAADDGTTSLVVDATVAFVDVDGDGIDDACESAVVADPVAAAAAEAAADLDGDGTISVSEAAQSGRVGGKNCNRGGYVSGVARAQCDGTDAPAPAAAPTPTPEPTDASAETVTLVTTDQVDENDQGEQGDEQDQETGDESSDPCTTDPAAATTDATVPCVPVAAPTFDPTIFTGPGAFGAYVSTVAKSDAIGGKNCNHGGAVSEAVKAAKGAATAAREAAKAERQAQRAAAKAARGAAHANHGKGKGGGH